MVDVQVAYPTTESLEAAISERLGSGHWARDARHITYLLDMIQASELALTVDYTTGADRRWLAHLEGPRKQRSPYDFADDWWSEGYGATMMEALCRAWLHERLEVSAVPDGASIVR